MRLCLCHGVFVLDAAGALCLCLVWYLCEHSSYLPSTRLPHLGTRSRLMGASAVFFSDLTLTLAFCLGLPCLLMILPVIPLTLSCLCLLSLVSLPCLLHLRLRCIDSPAQSTPQPLPCPLFNTIPSTLLLLLLLFSYVFTWTVRVHTRTPPSFQPGCSHISQTLAWPCLCISTCIASVQLNSPPL